VCALLYEFGMETPVRGRISSNLLQFFWISGFCCYYVLHVYEWPISFGNVKYDGECNIYNNLIRNVARNFLDRFIAFNGSKQYFVTSLILFDDV